MSTSKELLHDNPGVPSTPSVITVDEVSPVGVGPPVLDDEVGCPSVNLHCPSPALPQSSAQSPPGPLTRPYEQRAPPDVDRSSKQISGLKNTPTSSTIIKLWNFWCENFKPNLPFINACENKFRMKVGSPKINVASSKKRKVGCVLYSCPIDGDTFTRKQNLKREPLLVLFIFF